MTRERMHWMDLCRGVAVLLVVLWHAYSVGRGLGIDLPGEAELVNRALSPYRLPLLLLISGMLLPRSLAKPLGQYVAGKARHILWPFLLWTVVMGLLRDPSSLVAPVTWYAGRDHLWYLSTLLFCYAVAVPLRRVPGWVVAVAFWTVWLLWTPQVAGLSNWLWFGAYFFAGASLVRHLPRVQTLPGWVVAGLAAVTMVGVGGAVTGTGGYARALHWLVISLAGAVLLLWVAPRVRRGPVVQRLEGVGRSSIVYYIVHVPAILLAGRVLAAAGVGGWVAYVALVAVGLGVSWLVTRTPGHGALFSWPGRRIRQARATP